MLRAIPLHALPGGAPKTGSHSITAKKLAFLEEKGGKKGKSLRKEWEDGLEDLRKKLKNAKGDNKAALTNRYYERRETLTSEINAIVDAAGLRQARKRALEEQKDAERLHTSPYKYIGGRPLKS